MTSASLKTTGTIGGIAFNGAVTRSAPTVLTVNEDIPGTKAGTLTTRTDATNGVITMSSGHGLTNGQIINLYWTGGSRKGITVSISTNALTITGGTGDNLPSNNTALTVGVVRTIDIDFTIGILEMLVLQSDKSDIELLFYDTDSPTNLHGTFVLAASEPYWWASGTNAPDNPLETADDFPIAYFTVANPNTATANLRAAILLDSSGL